MGFSTPHNNTGFYDLVQGQLTYYITLKYNCIIIMMMAITTIAKETEKLSLLSVEGL
jgi:hypothetical protein